RLRYNPATNSSIQPARSCCCSRGSISPPPRAIRQHEPRINFAMMSRQFLFLIPMATAGVALLLSTGLSLAVSSTYTDVESCRSHDTEWDELLCLCDGPDGLAGILHYVEGKAFTVFGKSGGKS